MPHYLSKSDFKVAHDCPTKLYYRKKGYPNSKDQDQYLQFLARGGYMVGKLATLHYPEGILIDTGEDHSLAIKKSGEYLENENIILFEAAIVSKRKLIRVDILDKKGNEVKLVEVKSKSFETTTDTKKIKKIEKDLEEYIVDVAYQYFVIKEAYPQWNVHPYLYLPDKSKNTNIEGLNSLFEIKETTSKDGKFKKYDVSFDNNHLKELLSDDILTLFDIEQRVRELLPVVETEVKLFMGSLGDEIKKISVPLTKDCFKCEYNLTNDHFSMGGFDECWDGFPSVKHHIKDLYYIGAIGGSKNPLANQLINKKKISFSDFPLEKLGNGVRAQRQGMQIKYSLENEEWISENLKKELNRLEFPLHFIDFETTIAALPFHKGMRPYEPIVFQWSCYTLEDIDSMPVHKEWINLEPTFPNFKLAESLMKAIGVEGTPLMWSPYENTMLKNIYEQYEKYGYKNNELKDWLELMVKLDKYDNGRFVDMNRIALQNYFHPMMKGKTSIKWTFPAVLVANKSMAVENLLENFEPDLSLLKKNNTGSTINPYELLPKIELYDRAESIEDGTGAMRAYEDIMFGLRKGKNEVIKKYKQALLRYCKLDTLAMVIIWKYWCNKLGITNEK